MAFFAPDRVQQRGHVGDRRRLAIGGLVLGIVGLAVAAHVPDDSL